jgi:hypothetical protein
MAPQMPMIDTADVMFAGDPDAISHGALIIENAAFFRVDRCGDELTHEGDLVHFETPHVHRIWRLTGETDLLGGVPSYRGVWPD